MKKILIATPSIDGKVESVYAVSLGQTMVHGAINNINFMPAILSKNSIIQIARNELLNYARDFNVDGMIWIDSDTGWEASWCTRLVQHGEDIVGGAVPRKEDIPSYTFRLLPDRIHIDSRGLMEIAGNGTAFMYMSRKVIDWLWDNSPPYDTLEGERRWAFDVILEGRSPRGEDFYVCRKLREHGFKVWLDTTMSCAHVGSKTWDGDLRKWLIEAVKDKQRREKK